MLAALLFAAVAAPPLTQAPPRSFADLGLPAGAVAGPVIPGLHQDAVPQGLAYLPKDGERPGLFLISQYRANGAASRVSILAAETGDLRAAVDLAEPDGSPHTGHVGGLAVAGNALCVASDGRALRFPLAAFLSDGPPAVVRATAAVTHETRASFCAARDGDDGDELWVGEFARYRLDPLAKDFPTDPAHRSTNRAGAKKYAWVCRSDPADPTGTVTGVLSVRQRVQGLAFLPGSGDAGGEVVLSVSYGRANRSKLAFYRDPTGGPPHDTVTVAGRAVPLWFLDAENHVRTVDFPPMSEGVAFVPGSSPRLAVLAESGAAKYRPGGLGPLDVVILLPVARGE